MPQKHRLALALAALLGTYPTLAAAQEAEGEASPDLAGDVGSDAGALDDVGGEADEAPPVEADEAPPAEADEGSDAILRIGAAGGLGFVIDDLPAHTGELGMARLSVDVVAAPPVIIGLSGELQRYGRRYASPRGQEPVGVTETRLRYGLVVGLDVMNLAGERDPIVEIVPRLRVTFDTFLNDVFPQDAFAIGGDLAFVFHPDRRLSLTAEWSYSGVAAVTDADVASRLYAGAPIAEMRWSGGASWGATERLSLTANYEGEWLAYDHSSRFSHALVLGFLVSL